jgi:hypothetical protein
MPFLQCNFIDAQDTKGGRCCDANSASP